MSDTTDYTVARAGETTEGTVYTVTGQDWDSLTAGLGERAEERIVVNMGPQHPSTHGVLRLILELEGETVTECRLRHRLPAHRHREELRVPQLDPGRHLRDADGLPRAALQRERVLPRRREAARHQDEIPERANVIRVMLMELNRISSHLVALATGGMELGALTAMIFGFRERELVLDLFEMITGLRMNHAYIRPGGVAQDLPPGAVDQVARPARPDARAAHATSRTCSSTTRSGWRAPSASATSTSPAAWRSGITGPILRATGLPHDLRKSQPYCGYETYEFDVPTETTCDAYGRFLIRIAEMKESLKIVEQCLDRLQPGPVMVGRQEDRLAGAARPRRRRPGQLPRPHPAHHGPVDGGPDPPLQAGDRGLPGAGRAGLHRDRVAARRARRAPRQRRRHPAVPRALPRPVLQQPAGRPGDVRGQHGRRRHRGGRLASTR